jgi:hypothetical protein
MTTSNKLLLWAGAAIVLNILAYTVIMRNAYQKAIANPVSDQVKIDLKVMKYLKLNHYADVNLQYGPKYQVVLNRTYKDSLSVNYQGDTLSLNLLKAGEATIFMPIIPKIRVGFSKHKDLEIRLGDSFTAGNLDIFFEQSSEFILEKSHLDDVSIRSPKGIHLKLEKTDIKNLTMQTGRKSLVELNYANVQTNNIVLGDSSQILSGQYVNGKLTKDLLIK